MAKDLPESESKSKIDFSSWLVLGVVMVATLTTTMMMNSEHERDDLSKINGTINTDNGDEGINWGRYSTTDIKLNQSVEITQSGVYHLTGTLSDGGVSINVGKEGEVKLILDNVSVTNSSGPAIACYSADDLAIELVGENSIEDGESYLANLDEDVKGALYSKADLTFSGNGELTINAHYEDGIISKDDLKFIDGTYKITAKDDAIRGKDSVYIKNGTFIVEAGADAIKSTNETDNGKGFVLIENGDFNLTASAKGIKAINSILIYSGNFDITSHDDAIHSNNYIGIIDGDIEIASGDDGVHADRELIIDGGSISIAKSYEGLEAQKVTINNGEITITASDDGINAGGGRDCSANNRPGAGAFDADENCAITINGGEILVDASGDGLDSNGAIYFNGGSTTINGPTNNGNGALDAGLAAYIFGGEVIAVGSSGMAVSLAQESSIPSLCIYFSSTYQAGATITIKDSANKTILSHTATKVFSHATIGSDEFNLGETYSIYIDGSLYQTVTLSNTTTVLGRNNQGPNNNFRK